ncbi:MAG: carboxylating nicotinate-nucleotide diphosphorylase [Planctomycetes bacterium]|nr:carboxylating nicotinate-nucleotide diphosphorylase [Planctomycetota bacterium]
MKNPYEDSACSAVITSALAEDLAGQDDLTVAALVPEGALLSAELTAKADGVLCGLEVFPIICAQLGGAVEFKEIAIDGTQIKKGDCVLRMQGSARNILIAERTALNIAQRLSATATMTRQYVDAVAGTKAKILDTRKTTPGLRLLQKHAVVVGGGENHRIGLYDQILIKENHIALMDAVESGMSSGPADAVARCRHLHGAEMIVEVEIEDIADLDAVITAGASIVLLDNMGPDLLREAIAIRGERSVLLEASGGINLQTVAAHAQSGVDRISVGALTHSVQAFDLSLRCYPIDT